MLSEQSVFLLFRHWIELDRLSVLILRIHEWAVRPIGEYNVKTRRAVVCATF